MRDVDLNNENDNEPPDSPPPAPRLNARRGDEDEEEDPVVIPVAGLPPQDRDRLNQGIFPGLFPEFHGPQDIPLSPQANNQNPRLPPGPRNNR